MSRVPFVIRTRTRVWLCTVVALVATGLQVAWGFGHYPQRSTDALLMWMVVVLSLPAPPLITWRLFRAVAADASAPDSAARLAAFQVAVLTYASISAAMQLLRLAAPH